MHQEVQKTHFFVTSPKLKMLEKNVLLYRKRTRKVHLNIFASVDQNSQIKGLIDLLQICRNHQTFLNIFSPLK
jgi:hypothetical protein